MFQVAQPQFAPPRFNALPEYSPELGPCPSLDEQFVALLDAYRSHGGLARLQEVVARFKHCHGPDIAKLAQWIATRQVICFEWQSQSWLPLFQFSRIDMLPQATLGPLLAELVRIYDHWQLAHWFVRPHARLAQCTPVEAFAPDLAGVLRAAHCDRLAAAG